MLHALVQVQVSQSDARRRQGGDMHADLGVWGWPDPFCSVLILVMRNV